MSENKLGVKSGFLYDLTQKRFIDAYDGTIIGRSSGTLTFEDDALMSREHFKLINIGSQLYISDLDSTNGTRINGVRIGAGKRVPIHDDDLIEAGQQVFYYTFKQELPTRTSLIDRMKAMKSPR